MQQRLGGPAYYSNRQGLTSIVARHLEFPITNELAEQWLIYMEEALEHVRKEINLEDRKIIMRFFRFSAFYFVVACKYHKKVRDMGSLF